MGASFVKELSLVRGFKAGLLEGPETPAAPSGFAVYLLCMLELYFRLSVALLILSVRFFLFFLIFKVFLYKILLVCFLSRCFQLSHFFCFFPDFLLLGNEWKRNESYINIHSHTHTNTNTPVYTYAYKRINNARVPLNVYKYISINIHVAAAF